jgi:DNA-directed RNA polymerase specialized sigma24 family protein
VRNLASAEEYVREAISFVTGAAPDSFTVEVVPQLPGALGEEVAHARSAAEQAEQAQVAASALTREVLAKLAEADYNGRETAVILGVSKQRVSQLAGQPHSRAKSGSGGDRIPAKGSASSAPRAASRGTVQA